MTVVVIGSMRFPTEHMAAVLPHLRALVAATREHDGCLAYDAGQDIFEPGLIRFSELWPDAESLARHLAAPHIAPWRDVARSYGVSDRSFTAFDASGARAV